MTANVWSYGGRGACTDYAPTQAVDSLLVSMGLIDDVGNYRGVMSPNSMTRLSDITDGTSNTLLFAEDAGRPRGDFEPGSDDHRQDRKRHTRQKQSPSEPEA